MRPGSSFEIKPQAQSSSNSPSPCPTPKSQIKLDAGHLEFRCDTSKKRGVYVEKNTTMLPTLYEDGKNYQNSSVFGSAGKKQILSSLLEILSKRNISTQYLEEKLEESPERHESAPVVSENKTPDVGIKNADTGTLLPQIKSPEVQYGRKQVVVNTSIVSQPPLDNQPFLTSPPPPMTVSSKSCESNNYVFKNKNSGIYVFKDEKSESYDESESVCSCCSIESNSSSWINLLSLLILNQCNEDDTSYTPTSDDVNVPETLDRTTFNTETDDSVHYINTYELDSLKDSQHDPICERQEFRVKTASTTDTLNEFKGQGIYESSSTSAVESQKVEKQETAAMIENEPISSVEDVKNGSRSMSYIVQDNASVGEQSNEDHIAKEEEGMMDSIDKQSSFDMSNYGNTIQDLEVEVQSVFPERFGRLSERTSSPGRTIQRASLQPSRTFDSVCRFSAATSKPFRKSQSEFTNRSLSEYGQLVTPTRSDYSRSRFTNSALVGKKPPDFGNRRYTGSEYAARITPALARSKKSSFTSNLPAEPRKRKTKKKSKKFITRKRLQKQALVNSFKEELQKDLEFYEEPANFYQALRLMAHKKTFSRASRVNFGYYESNKTVQFDDFS